MFSQDDIFSKEASCNSDLELILQKGFYFKDDCCLLSENISKAKVSLADFQDKTGYECFVNKIHIEDLLPWPEKIPHIQICLQALHMLLEIAKKLAQLSSQGNYRFILSIDQDEEDPFLNSYILRFHKIRENECYLDANLELYESAMFVLDLNTYDINSTTKDILVDDLLTSMHKFQL